MARCVSSPLMAPVLGSPVGYLGRYHLALGIISLYHFYGAFNLYGSCYHHLEACHFITSLKFATQISFNSC
ncbi:hypothetical protein EDB87DRAFT_1589392 [Lactarius vividus]|nr:hypothetical protein EDB87DRAFT_1589392 [Lactarius vividus]